MLYVLLNIHVFILTFKSAQEFRSREKLRNLYLHCIRNKLWGVLRNNLTTFLAICIVLIDILNLASVSMHPEIIM